MKVFLSIKQMEALAAMILSEVDTRNPSTERMRILLDVLAVLEQAYSAAEVDHVAA